MKIVRFVFGAIITTLVLTGAPAFAEQTADDLVIDTGPTLYERLGGGEGVQKIISDTISLHLENPIIKHRMEGVDLEYLVASVSAFFSAGTGGPNNYTGPDMATAHAGMMLSHEEFDAAVTDVLAAVMANVDDGQTEHDEVQAILLSLRDQVVGK